MEHQLIMINDPFAEWRWICECGWKATGGLPAEVQQWHDEDQLAKEASWM